MDEQLIKSISLIKSSSYRQKILEALGSNIMTPAEIAKLSGFRLFQLSEGIDQKAHQKSY